MIKKLFLFLSLVSCEAPDTMPATWERLNHAWNNPSAYTGMMTTRGGMNVVSHDYIPLVAKVEHHAAICQELKAGLDAMEQKKEGKSAPIHNTVMQMDEEGCNIVPEWARGVSNEFLKSQKLN